MDKPKQKELKISIDELESVTDKELEAIMLSIENPVLLVLQAHMYLEWLLERFIVSELPKGNILVKNGKLTFYQKICVADAMDIIEPHLIDSLKKLNKIRNNLAHELNHEMTMEEIEPMGRTLGKEFSRMKMQANGCLIKLLEFILFYIIGCIATNTHISENIEHSH